MTDEKQTDQALTANSAVPDGPKERRAQGKKCAWCHQCITFERGGPVQFCKRYMIPNPLTPGGHCYFDTFR